MALAGRTVLVTGASAGIGRAATVALAGAGAKILATGRRKAELEALKKQCGGAVETIAGDLNDVHFVGELANAARDVDIFVNNAGVLKYAPLLDMTDDDCESMFRTNVLASFRITQRMARSMMERRRGHIIVMTSIAAREVYRLGVIYCTTKHALSAYARGLRIELQGHGVKVTEIAPGMVDTDIRDQRSSGRGGGRESQKVRGAHVGGSRGGGRVRCAGRTQLLSRSHRAATAKFRLASICSTRAA